MKKTLLIFSILLFVSYETCIAQDLKGKTLTAGIESDKFTFISNNKLIWTNSLNSEGIIKKTKLKYDYEDNLLRITLFWKIGGFLEAETYYLRYIEAKNYFLDIEDSIIWYFVPNKNNRPVVLPPLSHD